MARGSCFFTRAFDRDILELVESNRAVFAVHACFASSAVTDFRDTSQSSCREGASIPGRFVVRMCEASSSLQHLARGLRSASKVNSTRSPNRKIAHAPVPSLSFSFKPPCNRWRFVQSSLTDSFTDKERFHTLGRSCRGWVNSSVASHSECAIDCCASFNRWCKT